MHTYPLLIPNSCIISVLLLLNFDAGDNGIDLPYQVSVPNCDQPPCTIVRGETLVVTIDFFSRK